MRYLVFKKAPDALLVAEDQRPKPVRAVALLVPSAAEPGRWWVAGRGLTSAALYRDVDAAALAAITAHRRRHHGA